MKNYLKHWGWKICSVAVIASMLVGLFGIQGDLQIGNKIIRIGNVTEAAVADYTFNGNPAHDTLEMQTALGALPATGGRIEFLTCNITFNANITRAIANVTIEGVGQASYFALDGVNPVFTAGGNGWVFSNLRIDAGGIDMGATTNWMWTNVTTGVTYYAYRSPYGQSIFNDVTVASLRDTGLTDTRVPRAGAGGVISDDADLTFDGTSLQVSGANVTRSATKVVASSTASAYERAQADYVCDGTADETEINAAVGTGGRLVQLTDGIFNLSKASGIVLADNTTLAGYGKSTKITTLIDIAIDTMEYATNADAQAVWSGIGVTVSTNSTTKYTGTYSTKFVIDATDNRRVDHVAFVAQDWSGYRVAKVYGTGSGGHAIQFYVTDGINESYWNFTPAGIGSWTLDEFVLSAPDANNGANATLSGITGWGFRNLDSVETYYFDYSRIMVAINFIKADTNSGVVVRDLYVYGTYINSTEPPAIMDLTGFIGDSSGIVYKDCSYSLVENVWTENMNGEHIRLWTSAGVATDRFNQVRGCFVTTGSTDGIGNWFENHDIVEGNTVQNCKDVVTGFGIGVYTHGNDSNVISSNNVRNCNTGIWTWRGGDQLTIDSNVSTGNNQYGISVNGGDYVSVIGNVLNSNSQGIYTGSALHHLTITGNTFLSNTLYAIQLAGVAHGCTISASTMTSNDIGIYITPGGTTTSVTIIGNNIISSGTYGIYLTDIANLDITGNTLSSNGQDGILLDTGCEGATITGNACISNQNNGIRINSVRCTVSSNRCTNNTNEGIYLLADADNCVVIGNSSGNTAAGTSQNYGIFIDAGSNSHTITNNILLNNNSGSMSNGGTSNIIRWNQGYVTENSGTATILNTTTVIPVAHGLAITPTVARIQLTPLEDPTNTPGAIGVANNATATQFWIFCETDPGASNLDIGWNYQN